jgi:hypothetical protein
MYATLDPLKHFRGELSDADYIQFKTSFCEGKEVVKIEQFIALLDNTELIGRLRAEEYDLGVSTLVSLCGFGLFHLISVPASVGFSPMQSYAGLPYMFGIPQPYVMSPGKVHSIIATCHQNIMNSFY